MENSKTGASAKAREVTSKPSIEEMLSQGNWEERVAAARKKRDQLQSKNPSQRKRMTPTFPEFAPQFVEEPPAKPQSTKRKPAAAPMAERAEAPVLPVPPQQFPPTHHPAPDEAEPSPAVVVLPPSAVAAEVVAEKKGIDRAVLIAFTGFFGVGIGIALGAGLVWSLGGFNFNRMETAAIPPAATQPAAIQPATTQPPAPQPAATLPVELSPNVLQAAAPLRFDAGAVAPSFELIAPAAHATPHALQPVVSQQGLDAAQIAMLAPVVTTSAPAKPAPPVDLAPIGLLTAAPAMAQPATVASQTSDLPSSVPGAEALATPSPARLSAIGGTERTAPSAPSISRTAPQLALSPAALPAPTWATPDVSGTELAPLNALQEITTASVRIAPNALPGSAPDISLTVPYRAFTEIVLPLAPADLLTSANAPAATISNSDVSATLAVQAVATSPQTDYVFAPAEPAPAPGALSPPLSLIERFQLSPQTLAVAAPPAFAAPIAEPGAVSKPASVEVALQPTWGVPPASVSLTTRPDLGSLPRQTSEPTPLELSAALPTPFDAANLAAYDPASPLILPLVSNRAPAISADVWRGPSFWLGLPADRLSQVSLVLNVPGTVEDDEMAQKAANLGKTGLTLTTSNRVPFKITEPHIRYYNAANGDIATALGKKFGIEVRNFAQGSSGGPNRVEYWMAGSSTQRPAAVTPRKARTTRRTPARSTVRRVDPKTALRQKLARQLRSGDHL